MNKYNNANIIYWILIKCKRIIRSVLAFELYILILGFNIEIAIKGIINIIFKSKKQIPFIFCIDLKSLYNLLTKLDTNTEKRFLIDIIVLK